MSLAPRAVIVHRRTEYDELLATHGSPYTYDTHVPLIIMGPGIKADRYFQAATPADIAPTLAALLRVQAPSNAVGRVLIESNRLRRGVRDRVDLH